MKKIGIIISDGFGAGWSTWGQPAMATDQELAHAIDKKLDFEVISAIAKKNWPKEYLGGLKDCYVEWVDKGTHYKITVHDGAESIEFQDSDIWGCA